MKVYSPIIAVTLVLLSGLAACMPEPIPLLSAAWDYSQVRALDAADAVHPTQDILAAYTRNSGDEIQIRIDLLDHATLPDYDLYLAFDSAEGGTTDLPLGISANLAWDTLLIIPSQGSIQILDARLQPRSASGVLVLRDPILDIVTISIKNESLRGGSNLFATNHGFQFQIFLSPSERDLPADVLGPVDSNAPAPAPVPVLFTFWDSYPAYSPLTALRRWSGAHTGPSGGSHGLENLLQAARATSTPLVLLDLKNPAWLSALDYGNHLAIVKEMLSAGLLILPENTLDDSYAPFSVDEQTARNLLDKNIATTSRFGLPTSLFIYSPTGRLSVEGENRFIFTLSRLPEEDISALELAYIERSRGRLQLDIPAYRDQPPQAILDGPSLELKRAIVEAALMANSDLSDATFALILGGELPASHWGDPLPARRTLSYLTRHPWVHPLDAHDLQTSKSEPRPPSTPGDRYSKPTQNDLTLLKALQDAPSNILSTAAWQSFAALCAPIYPPSQELPIIREKYTNNIWSLLTAAEWAEAPAPLIDCSQDPDQDGNPECILASKNYYTQFEIESGALTHAFAILTGEDGREQAHQWIAPSSQFITGLSDPLFWNLDDGAVADPSVIVGAFAEPGIVYQVDTAGNCLIFTASRQGVRKVFCLSAGGLDVEYRLDEQPPFPSLIIPLALDPWRRFASDWAEAYIPVRLTNGWEWRLDAGPTIRILTSANLTAETFLDSRRFFDQPENPNKDYPPGHTLPFPMALVKIPLQGKRSIHLSIETVPARHLSIQ